MGKLLCYVLVGVWLCAALGCGRSVPGVPIDPVPDNVPNLYRTLYRELESELSLLNPVFENLWGRKSGTAVFGVELPAAAGHRDPRLPDDEQLPSAALTLDRLQSLGAKMVGLNVLYPVLTRDFPQSA